jgi:putative transposase
MMGHTYSCNLVHLVFSTKERKPTLREDLIEKFHQYIVGIARNHSIEMLASGGTADHVHALIGLPTTMTVSDAARVLKANSSRWLSEHGIDFGWQEGYGAFSVSPSQVPVVKAYIARQAEHHRKRDSREEFVELLQRCGVAFDPGAV